MKDADDYRSEKDTDREPRNYSVCLQWKFVYKKINYIIINVIIKQIPKSQNTHSRSMIVL
jgi:hypothetical protein